MLKKGLITVNMNAISMVDVDEKTNTGVPVMYMTGVINSTENRFDTNASVQNPELYDMYCDQVESDYAEFRKLVKEERDKLMEK